MTTNIIERIERHALEMKDGECWTTTYKPNQTGYVQIYWGGRKNKQRRYLHVIAYEAYNAEPVPEGMVVMHTCDNPSCFNPEHLCLGTQADNIADCISKGRFRGYKPGGY